MYPSEPLPHFVDDYLAYLYEVLPSQAGLDGVHLHDDLLEDLSRSGIDAHLRALSGFSRRLNQIDPALRTRMSRSGSTICASPRLMRSTALGLASTPITLRPRLAITAAVGSPT